MLIVLGLIGILAASAVALSRVRERPARESADARADPTPDATRTVVPDAPAGSATFRFLERSKGKGPWRFDPCGEIHYVTNLDEAPRGALADLKSAVGALEAASGLRFDFEGRTDEVARPTRALYQPGRYGERWAPLLVDWHDPRTSSFDWRVSDEGPLALGLASPRWSPRDPGVYVSGVIALNARDRGPRGFAWPWSRGVTMLHELGHAVGLAHVHARDEIMSTDGRSTATAYGQGDLAGLARLGADAGCLSPPPLPDR
ncbi:MAG: hypothetical protein WD206_06465 [Actinomycetota bacterium]